MAKRRFYLRYKEPELNNDVILLTFRSKQSLDKFLKNKKCNPISISTRPPSIAKETKSQEFILNQIEIYEQLLSMIGGEELSNTYTD